MLSSVLVGSGTCLTSLAALQQAASQSTSIISSRSLVGHLFGSLFHLSALSLSLSRCSPGVLVQGAIAEGHEVGVGGHSLTSCGLTQDTADCKANMILG